MDQSNQWTQNDTNASYVLNPRVTASEVGDTTNRKLTEIDYRLIPNTTVAEYGLVSEVRLKDGSTNLLHKKATTNYNLDTAYVSRRILGLPSKTVSWGYNQSNSQLEKVSEIDYFYDQGDFSDTSLEQNISSVIKHETAFGASFTVGRGNLTTSTRNDVTGATASVSSQVKYNIAGAPVAQIDPLGRTVKISYADNFNDTSTTRHTYAYPTKLYDPAGNYSEVKYRFDTGANVWAKSPAPAGNTTGKETTRLFDAVGRVERETVVNSGAYTRFEYPANNIQSKVFTTIVDTNNNGADQADEVMSESWTDGTGRVRKSRTEHPGSAGGWSGSLAEYDILGQVKRSTVPTETNSNYEPAGDDATRGWLWNSTEYDWKGRVTRTIPTDSTGSDGKDQLISYDGCGCAGGQVTTVQGELVPRDDEPSQTARRTQKVYQDILGRTYKTEVLNWTGAVYTTTVQTFNGRDQVTKTRQYAGDANSTSFQDVTMTYDGHGRMKTRHYPVENANTDTTWIYNADDSVQQTIDPRGAIQNFTYNSRGLVEQISYQVPNGSGIALTPTATFSYDAAGNRYLTADGSGTLTYSLDSLSRITSETKVFSGIPDNFTLNYEYQLNGDVKTLGIVPNNTSVSYAYDPTGRVTSVSGQGFSDTETNTNVSTIVSSLGYRAWNGVKSAAYGDTKTASLTYDNSLKVSSFRLPGLIETDYDQNNDGRTKFVNNLIDGRFDRSFTYDFRENLKSAKTGEEANGGSQMTGPYNTTVNFDAFGNLTNRSTVHWDTNHPYSFQPAYNNGRQIGAQHDAAGNVTGDGLFYEFDAAGNNVKVAPSVEQESGTCYETHRKQDLSYDADGQRSALYDETKRYCVYIGGQTILLSVSASTDYNVKSSVLGGKVVYVHRAIGQWTNTGQNSTGTIRNTKIYLGDKLLAVSQSTTAQQYNSFRWLHTDPSATTIVETKPNGQGTRFELDPFGADVGLESPYGGGNPDPPVSVGYGEMGSPEAIEWVEVDGVWAPANLFPGMIASASRCPRRGCGPIHTENGFEYWSAFADGYEGYLPLGATYAGGGSWSWNSWAGPRNSSAGQQSTRVAPTLKKRLINMEERKRRSQALASTGIWDNEGDLPKSQDDPQARRGFWAERAKRFLNDNPECEALINSLLADALGEQLGRDSIRSFIDEFVRSGTLLETVTENTSGGQALMPEYKTPGWGISVTTSPNMGDGGNAILFLSELMHSAGHRNGRWLTGDAEMVRVMAQQGITVDNLQFDKLWIDQAFEKDSTYMIDKIRVGNPNGPPYVSFGESWLFHRALEYKCGFGDKPLGVK